MRVISVKPLREFHEKHSDAEASLRYWIKATQSATWKTFADVKRTFSNADVYKQFTIFNIARNRYRLITAIHYNTACVYVRHILTHQEYDKGNWKA